MKPNLNLKHLRYFWVIAREGTLTRAAEVLDLAPQTLSGQLATFEERLGGLLFERVGRKLRLTDLGRTVWPYAQEIFTVADELEEVVSRSLSERPLLLRVGICASIHKLFAYHLIEPALQLSQEVTLQCHTGMLDHLMGDLKKKNLDLVLTDQMPAADPDFPFRQHLLERTTISLFAVPELAATLRPGFPRSLDGQPFLANSAESHLIRDLRQWFDERQIRFTVQSTVDDSALIKVFGRAGMGIFAAPTNISSEVCRQYNVEAIGQLDSVTEHLYAISRESRRQNPAIQAICQRADGDEA